MKAYINITIGFVCFCTLIFMSKMTWESQDQKPLFHKEKERASISFLLGTDNEGYDYFRLAEEHFLFDEEEKTDVMVKTCRSLEDMIDYLNHHESNTPWGTIQVVLHGNPFSGLSLQIENDGERATAKNLLKAMLDNPLPKLKTDDIDTLTKINFWACGIGKNPFINMALDTFFSLENGTVPDIYTSPHFVVFKESNDGAYVRRVNSTYWPYIFKRGYRPGDQQIANDMSKQFPEADVNWEAAIKVTNPNNEDEFQNSFHIPVSWTVVYPTKDSRPSVGTEEEKLQWVQSQESLMEQIEELNIPIDKFHWTVNKIKHKTKEGEAVPAIKAIGMATILCVLESEDEV